MWEKPGSGESESAFPGFYPSSTRDVKSDRLLARLRGFDPEKSDIITDSI
jgi:hypothetical protein